MKRSPFSLFDLLHPQPVLAGAIDQSNYSKPTGKGLLLFAAENSGDKETVRVRRRRRTSTPGPEGRERAEAPERERDSGGSAPPPSDPGGPSGSRPRGVS